MSDVPSAAVSMSPRRLAALLLRRRVRSAMPA